MHILMIENMDRLYELLEEEADERNFDACVTEAVSSEKNTESVRKKEIDMTSEINKIKDKDGSS